MASRTADIIGSTINSIQNLNAKQLSFSITCLVFLGVLLFPVVEVVRIMVNQSYWATVAPSPSMILFIDMLPEFRNNFTQLSSFVLPFFALIAGLQARSGSQSLFFRSLFAFV